MVRWLTTVVLVAVFIGLVYNPASAGTLTGRIIKEDGKSLSKSKVVIDGKEITTNDFGGYQVELADGERELKVTIDNVTYTSDKILIYSPRIEQNWRIDSKAKKLIKIR